MGARQSKQRDEVPTPTHMWNRNTSIEWTKEGAQTLLDEVKEMIRPFREKNQHLNVLVFGPTGCGKSSLCNGFRTALSQRRDVARYFAVGKRQDESYTRNFLWTEWEGVYLYDMAGVFESPHIKSEDILNIIQGKVAFTGEIDDFLHPKSLTSQEKTIPVSCVVLVLKPGMELGENLRRICGQIDKSAGSSALAYHVVLTHLDEEDDCFKDAKNLDQLFKSMKIQEAVNGMSEELGVPPNQISFVRNYVYEGTSDIKSTVMFLQAFKQIVIAACDQEEKRRVMAAAR